MLGRNEEAAVSEYLSTN